MVPSLSDPPGRLTVSPVGCGWPFVPFSQSKLYRPYVSVYPVTIYRTDGYPFNIKLLSKTTQIAYDFRPD
jgi:hypothetical protein